MKTKIRKICAMEFTLGIYGNEIQPIKICKDLTPTRPPNLTPVRMWNKYIPINDTYDTEKNIIYP